METKLVDWMACFQNTPPYFQALCRDSNSRMNLLVEGRWCPISEIIGKIKWHAGFEKIVSCNDSSQVWFYLPPKGVVRYDRYHYNELTKVTQLERDDHKKLQEHAAQFWQHYEEVDAGQEKKCVLQIMTTKYKDDEGWLTANYTSTTTFEHVTFRLVDPMGQVFSFGLQLENEEFKQLEGFFSYFKAGKAYLAAPDFEEPLNFHTKRVTSLSLTEERMMRIIDFVKAKNKTGIHFTRLHTNCAFVARELLQIIGAPTKPEPLSLIQCVVRALPYPFDSALSGICRAANAIFSFISFVAPPIGYFLGKIATVFMNGVVVASFGGTLSTNSFPPIIGTVSDLFDESISEIHTHFSVSDWQKKQATTKYYNWDGAIKMNGLIP